MKVEPLNFNVPQLNFITSLLSNKVNQATLIWGRGTGKSFIISFLIHTIIRFLPRSTWMIVGDSYKQLLTATLPGTFEALEKLGYKEHKSPDNPGNYVVGKRPPNSWMSPYRKIMDFHNSISFKNGTCFYIVSLDGGAGSTRGFSVDGAIEDEALMNDKEKLNKQIYTTIRGNLGVWGKRLHHGVFKFSSMPYGDKGVHLLKDANYYTEDNFEYEKLTNTIASLQYNFIKTSDLTERKAIWKEIYELNKKLHWYAKKGSYYSQANSFDNVQHLGFKFLERQYRELTDFEFQIEILNIRQAKLEGGFYPLLSEEKHGYRLRDDENKLSKLNYDFKTIGDNSKLDSDCVSTLPLRLAIDYGSNINCLLIAQQVDNEIRAIKDFYVKEVEDSTQIDELAKKFCDYYEYHSMKTVRFIKDVAFGNRRLANSKLTFNDQFIMRLRARGWSVSVVDLGVPISDDVRYILWQNILSETRSKWVFRINMNNAKHTYHSMSNTPVTDGRRGIEKDKSSERSKLIAQEDATHFSDCADQLILEVMSDLLKGREESRFTPYILSS